MPIRNGREIVVKYALFNLTHPNIGEAQTDLRSVMRKVGDHIVLGVNRNHLNTRAVVKAVYFPEDAAQVASWFQNRSWKDAVLAITDWEVRDTVREFVSRAEWVGDTSSVDEGR